MKKVTSSDIAKLAGVSRSTVSRVINGYSNVPPETKEKVMQVIREHHYYPLLSGQMLTGKSARTLGLFWVGSSGIANDPLVSSFFMHVVDAATQRGYLVLSSVMNNLSDRDNADQIRKIFMEGRIDGGIFIGPGNNEPLIDELISLDRIVGLFDYYHENEDVPNRLTVNFDRSTAEKSIDYLYSLGHRKIAVIDGDLGHASCLHRHEGYIRGLMKYHLPIQTKWMAYGGIVSGTGYEAAMQMLSGCAPGELPTAICANNDSAAFGVYRACKELGLRIPEDISIVGTDGHANGQYIAPPLTTFAFDFKEMFASLVNRVIDVIEGKENVPQSEFIEGKLLERDSCRPVSH